MLHMAVIIVLFVFISTHCSTDSVLTASVLLDGGSVFFLQGSCWLQLGLWEAWGCGEGAEAVLIQRAFALLKAFQ